MTFANTLPWWGLLAAAAGCGLVAWHAYGRAPLHAGQRAVLSLLRFAALAWVVICLMRPMAVARPEHRDGILPVLVDVSRSMSLPDADGRPRIQQARAVAAEILASSAAPTLKRELLAFGDRLSPVSLEGLAATDAHTNIGDALRRVRERYRGEAVAGVVLLSDGGDNGGVDIEEAAANGPPVIAIGIGSASPLRDREVLSVTSAAAVLDDATTEVTASAVEHGYGNSPFQLRLLENGKPIDVRSVTPARDGIPVSTVFTVSPPRGAATTYTVEVPGSPDELVPENNDRSVVVPPPRPALHVLLVEGAPGFEHAFLERALSNDSAMRIDSIIRKGKDDRGQNTFYVQAAAGGGDELLGGVPVNRASLFAYDVVVLANVDADELNPARADLLRAFVAERGGGLLVLGARGFERQGFRGTALESVLPLDVSNRSSGVAPAANTPPVMNRVTLTAAGEAHPIMQIGRSPDETKRRWAAIPPLAAVSSLGAARPGSSVLALTAGPGGVTRALVAVHRLGEGRAMVFTGEASWRWRMMLPADDHSYDRFWRQSVRWLGQNAPPPVQVSVPSASSAGDISIDVVARDKVFVPQRGATVDVQIIGADGAIASARGRAEDGPPGHYTATVHVAEPGLYRVGASARLGSRDLGAATGSLLVGGADEEFRDPRLDTGALSRIARASGGAAIAARDIPAALERLRVGIPAVTLAQHQDLWSKPWSFAILVALLSTEWLVRRRLGLP
ncbi:MAG TPA: glutamine amidotransferase [Vicinamibacterales bacterium]|nr:glutamine amidotransferase [Vicinamibacterales bacterium]